MSYLKIAKRALEKINSGRATYPIPPPPADPQAEAEEIARRVMEHGICLLYAETMQDFIAFVKDDYPREKVLPCFVIYTDAELKELFGKVQTTSPATLRLIHEAKKQGGKVIPNKE